MSESRRDALAVGLMSALVWAALLVILANMPGCVMAPPPPSTSPPRVKAPGEPGTFVQLRWREHGAIWFREAVFVVIGVKDERLWTYKPVGFGDRALRCPEEVVLEPVVVEAVPNEVR